MAAIFCRVSFQDFFCQCTRLSAIPGIFYLEMPSPSPPILPQYTQRDAETGCLKHIHRDRNTGKRTHSEACLHTEMGKYIRYNHVQTQKLTKISTHMHILSQSLACMFATTSTLSSILTDEHSPKTDRAPSQNTRRWPQQGACTFPDRPALLPKACTSHLGTCTRA